MEFLHLNYQQGVGFAFTVIGILISVLIFIGKKGIDLFEDFVTEQKKFREITHDKIMQHDYSIDKVNVKIEDIDKRVTKLEDCK